MIWQLSALEAMAMPVKVKEAMHFCLIQRAHESGAALTCGQCASQQCDCMLAIDSTSFDL